MSTQGRKRKERGSSSSLPPIPDKVYFTIGEVSALCQVKAHVIRYWETEFKELVPTRRRNRRYYKRKEIELIRKIRALLYQQGYTIEGARGQLSKTGAARTKRVTTTAAAAEANADADLLQELKSVLKELES